MTSPKLQLLQKQMRQRQQQPEPAPATDSLAAAIEALVEQQVAKALAQRQEARPSPAVAQRLGSLFQPSPEPVRAVTAPSTPLVRTPAPIPLSLQIERDAAGMARAMITGDGRRFVIARGADMHITRFTEDQTD